MPEPLATIVIPVWNRPETLGRAIASVLAQTEPNLELIVVDNGSDDGPAVAALVVAASDDRLRLVRLPENLGPGGGRNAGASAASGRLLGFLDSDDEFEPTWLANLSAPFEHPSTGVVTCGFRRFENGHERYAFVPEVRGPAFHGMRARFDGPPAYLVARNLFDEVGGYAEQLWFGENTEIGLRIVDACLRTGRAVAAVDEPLLRFHAGRPGRYEGQVRLDSAEFVLERHHALLEADRPLHSSYLAVAGVAAVRVGEDRRARSHFRALLRVQPSFRNAGRVALAMFPPLARLVWKGR